MAIAVAILSLLIFASGACFVTAAFTVLGIE
jgi:hypothetical protein